MSGSIQEARDELIRQEQLSAIGRLASSIVHDLRNPLAAIYGGAEMMVDGELNPQQTQRVAQSIYRSSRVIKDLLQELVDVSRGRMQAPELCALWEIVGAAIDSQRPLAEQQNVTIEASIDPEFEVLLERGRMERVFLNLVSNALEAMPDGGRISIEAERQDDQVIVRVTDTGPGIPREIGTGCSAFRNRAQNQTGAGAGIVQAYCTGARRRSVGRGSARGRGVFVRVPAHVP